MTEYQQELYKATLNKHMEILLNKEVILVLLLKTAIYYLLLFILIIAINE